MPLIGTPEKGCAISAGFCWVTGLSFKPGVAYRKQTSVLIVTNHKGPALEWGFDWAKVSVTITWENNTRCCRREGSS